MKNFLEAIKSAFTKEVEIEQPTYAMYASSIRENTAIFFSHSESTELGLKSGVFKVAFTARVGDNVFMSLDSINEDGSVKNVSKKLPAGRKVSVLV